MDIDIKDKILKLKQEIREELKLACEISVGAPIISEMKSQIDNSINKYNKLVKIIRMKSPELLETVV